MEILSKITMRTIAASEVKSLLGDNESVEFAQIYGFCTGQVKGDKDTQYGPNLWLAGEFKAKNLINGNMFYSPKLYAPEILHNIVCAQLEINEGGSPTPKLLFAFIVGIKKSKAIIGYEYTVKSLIEPKEDNNPFAQIESQIKEPANSVSGPQGEI